MPNWIYIKISATVLRIAFSKQHKAEQFICWRRAFSRGWPHYSDIRYLPQAFSYLFFPKVQFPEQREGRGFLICLLQCQTGNYRFYWRAKSRHSLSFIYFIYLFFQSCGRGKSHIITPSDSSLLFLELYLKASSHWRVLGVLLYA